MKIIICGAGKVGSTIATQLAREGQEVTLIDQNPELVSRINDSIDATAILGHASHPQTLEKAGAGDADMLIAVTHSDEVNMVACQIGYSVFNVPTKIARVRHQQYLQPEWKSMFANDHVAVDAVISPEIEVGNAVIRRLHTPGAVDSIPFMDGKLRLTAVRCESNCPVLNLPMHIIAQRAKHLTMRVIGVTRDASFKAVDKNTMLKEGDTVYFVSIEEEVRASLQLFGHHEQEARRLVILGGGNIGLYVAQQTERDEKHPAKLKIVEFSKQRAEHIANIVEKATILRGSALDKDVLQEAGIEHAQAVVALTNDDETNILGSLLAKRYGCERAITLVNNAAYAPLWGDLGLDVIVNPRETTISSILQHIRRGRIRNVHSIANGMAEMIEAEAIETSSLIGKHIDELGLPKDVMICAIMRDDKIFMPDEHTQIHENDDILILTSTELVRKVEQIFSVSVEYF